MKENSDARICFAFQPHSHSATKDKSRPTFRKTDAKQRLLLGSSTPLAVSVKKHLKTESQTGHILSVFLLNFCVIKKQSNISLGYSLLLSVIAIRYFYKTITPGQWRGWKCFLPSLLPLILVSGYKGQDSPNTIQSILQGPHC